MVDPVLVREWFPMLVDTHCHLDLEDFAADLNEIVPRARESGVGQIITVGIDLPSSRRAAALASAYEELYAAVGVHPHNACRLSTAEIQELTALCREPGVVGYGEIGLDYYRTYQPHEEQRACLRTQLNLARHLGLPVVIHDREAHEDMFRILKEERVRDIGGVMHCFSGDWSFARRCLDLGLYISIAGPVTFPKARQLQEVVRRCPADRLLLETDAPFLAPVPRRGKRNEPAYLPHTAEKVASIREVPLAHVAAQTTLNARCLFGLPDPPDQRAPSWETAPAEIVHHE
jgi:TatD DNase family protein